MLQDPVNLRHYCSITGMVGIVYLMKIIDQFDEAHQLLKQGKILAYPTEAVYGLGCNPFNEKAVERLLALKKREHSKGLIVLIADWSQLSSLTSAIPFDKLDAVRDNWPGPVTYVFPKSAIIPDWLCGNHNTVAIRMSAHPVARKLCKNGPIISTSANLSGHPPAIDEASLCAAFPVGIDALVSGPLGGSKQLSVIYDVLSGERLR